MQFIKDLLRIKSEDDNIPEIHLHKDPKVYYDSILKKYIIEGEENVNEKKKSSGPPKYQKTNDNLATGPQVKEQNESGARISQRYINYLTDDNMITTSEQQQQLPNKATNCEDDEYKLREAKRKEMESELEKEKEDQKGINQNDSDKEDEKREKKEKQIERQEKDKDQFENEVQISEIEHKEDVESSFAPRDLYYQHMETEKVKSEYKAKMLEMQSEYQEEINQLKESVQFYEEDNEESTKLLKNQITDFINENLELKMSYEKAKDELSFKQKEIEEYQKLFEYYRKLVDDNSISKQQEGRETPMLGEKESSIRTGNQLGSDYVYINSKIEKLETEKIILNNDLIELKSENESIKLEKDYLIKKASALEGQNNKIKADLIQIEASFQDLHSNYKTVNHLKEELDHQISLLKQEANSSNIVINDKKQLINSFQKTIDDSNKKIIQLTKHIEVIQTKNEKLNKELRSISEHFNQTVDEHSQEKKALLSRIESDSLNYNKKIEALKTERDNLMLELNDRLMQLNQANSDIDQFEKLKYENFTLEKSLEGLKDQIERITAFAHHQSITYPSMAQVLQLSTSNDFDNEICSMIMNMIAMNDKVSSCHKEMNVNCSIAKNENDNLKLELKLLKTKMAVEANKNHKLLYKTINDSNQAISALKNINSRLVPKKFKDDYYTVFDQLNESKEQNALLQSENETLKNKVTTLMQILQEEKMEYESKMLKQLDSHSEIKLKLEKQFEEMEQKYQSYQNTINDKENDLDQLKKERMELVAKHQQLSSECILMKDKISELMNILSSMQEEAEEIGQSEEVLRKNNDDKIKELNERVRGLNDQLKEEEAKKEEMENMIKDLQDEIQRLNRGMIEMEEKNDVMNKEYQNVNEFNAKIKEEALMKEKEKERLIEEHSDILFKMEKDNRSLEQKLAETIMLLKEYDKETNDSYTNTDIEVTIKDEEKEKQDEGVQYPEGIEEKNNQIKETNQVVISKEKDNEDKEKEEIQFQTSKRKEQPQQQSQPPVQKLGFLGRLMAPLFLTEKEYETLGK